MFDKFKAMGAVAGLLKNQDTLKESFAKVQEQMARTSVTGQAGGGAVRVVASGQLKVLSVELSPALVAGMAGDDKTRSLAGSLIVEATNEALKMAQEKLKEAIDRESKVLGLPDLGGGGLAELMG